MNQQKMTKIQKNVRMKRIMGLTLILLLMVTLVPSVNLMGIDIAGVGEVYGSVATGLQTSGGTTSYNKNSGPAVIDPNLTIGGIAGNISEASVMIRNLKAGDTLHYSTVHGITGNYVASTGILSLSGVTTAGNYENALRSVTFSTTSSNTEARNIDFVLGRGLYFEGTGHFYEYVDNGSDITWQAAKTAAEARNFFGRQGYLVTITSAAENAFVSSKALGVGWIGARDINRNVNTGSFIAGGLSNGDWRWVTGPEAAVDGGKGLRFYRGYQGYSPQTVPGVYSNWAVSEPNNYQPINEWVVHIFGSTDGINYGKWNDFNPSQSVRGYIVEYGGMASDVPLVIQASKGIVISNTQLFTVTFEDHNGIKLKEETVEQGSGATAPTTPTRTGYTFAGWDKTFTNITENITVTATYTANINTPYTVEHYQQDVTGTGYTLFETKNLTGTTNTTVNATGKSYTGFSENTTHISRITSGIVAPDGTLVLKLYYDRDTYTVIFKDHDNTTLKNEIVRHGGSAIAPTDPTRIGYTFAGWDKVFSNTIANSEVTATYTANTNTAYKTEHYQETLEGEYVKANTDNLTGTTNTTATASAKTYTGFSENTTHLDRVVSGNINGDGSTVLKLYYDRDEYTVTFKDHEGSTIDSQSVKYQDDASPPTSPTREGYTFIGWDTVFEEVTANLTVTANYDINSYNLTVNYTMMDGSTAPDSYTATLNFNETYSVVSPSLDGYTPNVATVSGTIGTSDITEEVTYSANGDTAYTVEHYQENLEGEYVIDDTENLTGTTNTTATASAKTYTGFSENTTHLDRVASGNINGDGSTVLKLYYDRDEYTVAFKDHDGSVLDTQLIKYQNNVSSPVDPTRSGFTFRGWYEDEELTNAFDFDTLIVEDKNLYARWSRIISGTVSTPQQGNTIVTVNGVAVSAGTETTTTEDGKSTVTVDVKNKVIESKIDEVIKTNTIGTGNYIQIPVADTKSEVVKVQLSGDIVKKLEENNFDVSVKWDNVEYIIPAEEFTISKVAKNLGVTETDLVVIKVEVKMTKLDEKVIEKYKKVAKEKGVELVFPPVAFEVVAKTTKTDGITGEVEINKFSKYVERVLEISEGVGPNKITTGIVFNQDGGYSHVPTEVFQKDGKWYAKLNSLTNSEYSVIWNGVTVKSVENHWSKDAVNDMASRLIIFNTETFAPDKGITRADFAEYIVRALGLYRDGLTPENKFKDVRATGDRTLAILIASEYGIVAGYPDGTFRPDALITREEAMTMYHRAMKITKITGSDTTRYQNFTDYGTVSSWAEIYVQEVLSAHVFNGTSTTIISPKSNLTYAEAAQAIKNLLVESKLINK